MLCVFSFYKFRDFLYYTIYIKLHKIKIVIINVRINQEANLSHTRPTTVFCIFPSIYGERKKEEDCSSVERDFNLLQERYWPQ